MQRRGGLSEIEVRYFMKQMIEGVRFMQDDRVLHRDLKIGNTFIDEQMRIKIGDFGLAVRLQGTERPAWTRERSDVRTRR